MRVQCKAEGAALAATEAWWIVAIGEAFGVIECEAVAPFGVLPLVEVGLFSFYNKKLLRQNCNCPAI